MKRQIYSVRDKMSKALAVISNGVYRILDANANRAREGLRVLEDIARFIHNDEKITNQLKRERHRITSLLREIPGGEKILINARDSSSDVGAKTYAFGEKKRDGIMEVAVSNLRRSQEAIRVMEEFTKIYKETISKRFKAMRFRLYTLEKKFRN